MYNIASGQVQGEVNNAIDNEKSYVAIEENMTLYDELFVNVSHELRTPLNIIYGAAQLIEQYINNDLTNDLASKIASSVSSIKLNHFRLMKLTNNIIDIHRLETGLFKLNYSFVNIVEVVENVVECVTNKVDLNKLSIIFDTDTEEKYMFADVDVIQRILLNLLSNAVKFSSLGNKIFVNITTYNNSVNIAVTDMGIGIDKKHIASIFNMHSQVDKSISRTAEGSGLGLRVSKLLAKKHEGDISVISKPQTGSTFIVKLQCNKNDNIYTLYSKKVINYDSLVEMIKIEFSDIIGMYMS